MSFLTATLVKAVTAIAGVIDSIQAEYSATTRKAPNTSPQALRQALWLLFGVTTVVSLTLLYWLLPDDLKAKDAEGVRNYGLIAAALVGLPLAIWRSSIAASQAKTAIDQAATANKQAFIAERGQVTDRFNKAIEQLAENHGEGRNGKESLTVRIGAIYALGRIAKDSPDDAQAVFDVLSSYVRAEFPLASATNEKERLNIGELEDHDRPDDLKAVMSVCRDVLSESSRRVDFSGCDLRNVDLYGAKLTGSKLNDSDFSGAYLIELVTAGSDLTRAKFVGATLYRAQLVQATLNDANFENAKLGRANLSGSKLFGTKMAGADLGLVDLSGVKGWSEVMGKPSIQNLDKAKNVPTDDETE